MRPPAKRLVCGAAPLAALLLFGLARLDAAPRRGAVGKGALPIVWTDLDGRGYGPVELRAAPATVFLFLSTECPAAAEYVPRIRDLEAAYHPRGARFFLVSSHPADTVERLRRWAAERELAIPIFRDPGALLADRLGATRTPEAAVVGREGELLYRGAIDDSRDPERVRRRYLAEALAAVLAGRRPPAARARAEGCLITREAPPQPAGRPGVTWSGGVGALLHRRCAECHRPGEVAPFPLLTYRDARPWAPMLREVTRRRIMPPWKPLPGYGDFHDARALAPEEVKLLARWADAGAPEGDPKLAPEPPRFPSGWALGPPDLELRPAREYRLAAEGADEYRCFVLPVEFRRDAYVRAAQFRPGNRAVVHHVTLYVDAAGRSLEADARDPEDGFANPNAGAGPPVPGAALIAAWAPGNRARPLPEGTAARVPKGARLVMEVHYHRTGRPERDRTAVGLTLARETVRQVPLAGILVQPFLNLPAGDPRIEVRSLGLFLEPVLHQALPEDMTLHVIAPHMHLLGREMRVRATLPDGERLELLWLKDWDFNRQESYSYREPVRLPKGTKLQMTAWFDNSAANPRNPNRPPKPVTWGERTADEMCLAFLALTRDAERLEIRPAPPAETAVPTGAR